MSLPGARKVAGGLVCAPYVVGNLKEIKSDTPNEQVPSPDEQVHMNVHICVCTSKHEYRIHTCSNPIELGGVSKVIYTVVFNE